MHLEDVLQHRGTYTMEKYAPQVPSLKFVPETGIDIGNWVKNEAEHIIFVYGEIDPWAAGAFEIDPSRDLHAFIVPGASHGANFSCAQLAAESRALALEVLERWTASSRVRSPRKSKRCKQTAKRSISTCHRNECAFGPTRSGVAELADQSRYRRGHYPTAAVGCRPHDRDSPIPSFGWPLMAA